MGHEERGFGAGAPATPEPHAGTFVERAITHHHLGDPGGHRHRGVCHGPGRGAAAVRYPAEEVEVTDTHIACDIDLVAGVHRERDHAVDLAGCHPGIVKGCADRLARQLQLAAPGLLGELGLANSQDRGGTGQRGGHGWASARRLSTAVPET